MDMAYRFVDVPTCNMCNAQRSETLGRRLNGHQGLRPVRQRGITVSVVRCLVCGLIYSDPQPIPIDTAQLYAVDPAEYWQSEYFTDDSDYFDGQIATFRRLWTGGGQPTALDIGAGIGKAMNALQRAGIEATGIEVSDSFRMAALANGIAPDRLHLCSVEDADLPTAGFDLVTFGAVLEHLPDPAGAIERSLAWTARGGLIHIEVPSARWLTSRLTRLAYRLQGLDYVPHISPMHTPYHLYEFTLDAFAEHGRRAGYVVEFHTVYVAQTYLPRLLAPLATRYMRRTKTGMQLEVWLRPDAGGQVAPKTTASC
jgi:ubiquinone/menaquinone biosynthesis C-methylase UbiE